MKRVCNANCNNFFFHLKSFWKKTCCNHVVYGGLPPSMPLYGKCPKALAIECWSKEIWLDIKLISFDNKSSGLYWFWCWWEEKRCRARCTMVPNGGRLLSMGQHQSVLSSEGGTHLPGKLYLKEGLTSLSQFQTHKFWKITQRGIRTNDVEWSKVSSIFKERAKRLDPQVDEFVQEERLHQELDQINKNHSISATGQFWPKQQQHKWWSRE